MPKKKKPGEKWFDRPSSHCKHCGASLQELDATEQHWAGACSGMQMQGAARGKTEELQCFTAEDETQVFRLHFLARSTATFADLDAELRRLWLECCGHCTQFALLRDPQPNIIPHDSLGCIVWPAEPQELCYISGLEPEDGDQQAWRPQERERLWARLPQPRLIASHSYDFGTTTTTLIIAGPKISVPKAAADRLFAGGRRLALVARNERPQIPCCECGKPARFVRNEGSNFSDKSYADFWCSRACARRGDADYVDCFFNSPRSGVCGYRGPLVAEEGEEEALWGSSAEEGESSSSGSEGGWSSGSSGSEGGWSSGSSGSEETSEGEEEEEEDQARWRPAARGSARGKAAAKPAAATQSGGKAAAAKKAGGKAAAKPAAAKPAAAKKAGGKKAAAKPTAAKPAAAGKKAGGKPAAVKPAAAKPAAGKKAAAKPAAAKAKTAGVKRQAPAVASTRSKRAK